MRSGEQSLGWESASSPASHSHQRPWRGNGSFRAKPADLDQSTTALPMQPLLALRPVLAE